MQPFSCIGNNMFPKRNYDNGEKLIASVVDTSATQKVANISANFRKNSKSS
jgi:hypothetical protein